MRLLALLIGILLVPGCVAKNRSVSTKLQAGELAYRVQRTDGITWLVQVPSVESLRSILNELECGQSHGCTVGFVRMTNTTHTAEGVIPAPMRATIKLAKDTQAGSVMLPAGIYQVYFNQFSPRPKLMFVPVINMTTSQNTVGIPCDAVERQTKNHATTLTIDDGDTSQAVLRSIQIRGETATYIFSAPSR